MAENNGDIGNIELSLPANAAYVSAARQTATSIAGRLGFDADEVEDIKAAVSEACIYAIRKLAHNKKGGFKLVFIPSYGFLEIRIYCPAERGNDTGDYSLMLVKGLTDSLKITEDSGFTVMVMTKRHKDANL